MSKVSVVIPVYGVERYIHQLLESIEHQSLKDIEVIFVDDGSPDNCPAILDEFVARDERYKVIHQKNGGVSVARNTGLAQATGKYVYIADSDDWLAEGALEALWSQAERTGADLVYGDYYREKNGISTLVHPFPASFVTEDPAVIKALQCAVNTGGVKVGIQSPMFQTVNHMGGAPWRVMIRRSILEENNIRFDPYVKGLGDDILFSLHVYEHVRRVAYVQAPIYHYRILNVSYSHGFKANLLENYGLIFERMEHFLRHYKKEELHWNAYYLRVYYYTLESLRRYFRNTNNPKSEKERFEEFVSVMKSEPYHTAVQKLPLKWMLGKRSKMKLLLLRFGQYKLFWRLLK